ncbi:hypothetical protein ES319_A02G098000v1 [Gossypium barbadense]|uniref:CBL-interacting serine/threonine-protein kinase 3 n=4 Tax=Gossypium TaxID=3633 RepID=A0A1U8MTN2_GOSHI|nr:CBL-interacting serine/threonine-protein kinase 3-like [Gossypium hirsutum]KAB2093511.1 hypothetical protein ES319_A02G098000v1 [Gossypium barbadense]TXG74729.1 hypothetical protein ES288_1Z016000v1 [Gossypium darwinii]TYH27945.1 hypothetical protein ES288_A02G107800v1 [Gossypium darwinii]TYI39672.1 hypothetical protein ES332_A02G110600v1 [Gossypium tomentosum]
MMFGPSFMFKFDPLDVIKISSCARMECWTGMNQPKIKGRVGKYQVGRTIGEGTFAKVKFARNSKTGEPVALKILDKDKVLKHKMAEQIKQEIATMKLIKHPNVIRLHEALVIIRYIIIT